MSRKFLAGGAALLTLVGFCGFAAARDGGQHTMTVTSPDGGTVTIRYSGDVAPRVAFGTADAMQAGSPFAMMDRIAAEMDRQMDAMIRQTNEMIAHLPNTNPTVPADFWNMPDVSGLTAVANGGKGSFCMKSVEITSTGDGKAPHVVTHSAGNCGAGAAAAPSHPVRGTGPRTSI